MKKFEFKPFDKVLVRDGDQGIWKASWFSHYNADAPVACGVQWQQSIPYEGNEKMLGTADPYIEPYEPEDGDFVYIQYEDGVEFIICVSDEYSDDENFGYYLRLGSISGELWFDRSLKTDYVIIRPATEEEKQLILDNLHKVVKDWDAEKKEIVDYKWKPNSEEKYWSVRFIAFTNGFGPAKYDWENDYEDIAAFEKGLVFKTKEEADKKAQELNERLFGKAFDNHERDHQMP